MMKDLFVAFVIMPALLAIVVGVLYLYWKYPVLLVIPAGTFLYAWYDIRKYERKKLKKA